MMDSTTEIVTSFKDREGNEQVITGKDAYLTNFEVNYPSRMAEDIFSISGSCIKKLFPQDPITINLEFQLNQFDKDGKPNYIIESFMNGFKPKRRISKLRVEDCSTEELLFAVRQNIKSNKRRIKC